MDAAGIEDVLWKLRGLLCSLQVVYSTLASKPGKMAPVPTGEPDPSHRLAAQHEAFSHHFNQFVACYNITKPAIEDVAIPIRGLYATREPLMFRGIESVSAMDWLLSLAFGVLFRADQVWRDGRSAPRTADGMLPVLPAFEPAYSFTAKQVAAVKKALSSDARYQVPSMDADLQSIDRRIDADFAAVLATQPQRQASGKQKIITIKKRFVAICPQCGKKADTKKSKPVGKNRVRNARCKCGHSWKIVTPLEGLRVS